MKKTKKSLLFSGLALMMSALLLVGTTFAWFTDSVTNKGNKIEAGTLKVQLLKDSKDISNSTEPVFNYDKWEPGYSTGANLSVKNNGTLAIKYELELQNVKTTKGIENVINVYVGDDLKGTLAQFMNGEDLLTGVLKADEESASTEIKLAMQTSADNDYQGATASFDILLKATQATVEKDGFGSDQYDKDAYVADFEVADTTDLESALNEAKDGDVIALTQDVTLSKPLTIKKDVTINGMGATISGQPITVMSDVTFKDVTLSKPTNASNTASLVYGYTGCETLTFEGCTFSDPQWEAIQITSADFKNLVVNNCTFTAANVEGAGSSYGNSADEAIRYIHIQPAASDNVVANITITNNTFKNCDKVKDSVVGIYYVDGSTITVGGNTFENLTDGETSAKLSVGWPEENDLKVVSNWTGEPKTFSING